MTTTPEARYRLSLVFPYLTSEFERFQALQRQLSQGKRVSITLGSIFIGYLPEVEFESLSAIFEDGSNFGLQTFDEDHAIAFMNWYQNVWPKYSPYVRHHVKSDPFEMSQLVRRYLNRSVAVGMRLVD